MLALTESVRWRRASRTHGSSRDALTADGGVDRGLLSAAVCAAGATVLGAVVSWREDLPGEPLGLRPPGRVASHLGLGLGSALSAPWPMPALAVLAALRARSDAAWPARTCAAVGTAFVAGTLVEPVTWGQRVQSRAVGAAITMNLAAGVGLAVAGLRRARRI